MMMIMMMMIMLIIIMMMMIMLMIIMMMITTRIASAIGHFYFFIALANLVDLVLRYFCCKLSFTVRDYNGPPYSYVFKSLLPRETLP